MVPLSELQQRFCDGLLTSMEPSAELLAEIVDDGFVTERFNIYRNNFVVLNGDALADMYPAVKRLVGCEAFRLLATAYVRRYPPTERALLLYGERFPEFIATIPELSALPYLSGVARLEYLWTEVYHAEDARSLTPQQVAKVKPQVFSVSYLVPHPTLRLLQSEYPLFSIWEANQEEDSDRVISLDEGAVHLALIRPGTDVEVRVLGRGEYCFLEALQRGCNIEEALVSAMADEPDFDLSAFLSRHLFDGTFNRLDTGMETDLSST